MTNHCPLCNARGEVFYKHKKRLYFQCAKCWGIYLDENLILDRAGEKSRYQKHNNDVKDAGYQNFVSPITNAVFRDFSENDKGLDFGAGPGPVIAKLLTEKLFNIKLYDPYFHNNEKLIDSRYNYIVCCEVMEHFSNPNHEFSLLKQLMLPKGKLYCLTHIYDESIEFSNWYYKNDPTHIFFYHKKTLEWIKEEYNFYELTIEGKLITFSL